jgi:hypothetical protein
MAYKSHILSCFFCIIAFFLVGSAYGQIKPNHVAQLKENYLSEESFKSFVNENKFEYALLAYGSSGWGSFGSSYSGLVKKNAKWYLAQINYSTIHPNKGFTIKQKKLLPNQIDSLWLELKPDSAFLFTRKELIHVLVNCRYSIVDAGGISLAEFSNGEVKMFGMDAPEEYLKHCSPAFSEILRVTGFINTSRKLVATANAIR